MKLLTTLLLTLLVAAGATLFVLKPHWPWHAPSTTAESAGTRELLSKLHPDSLASIAIRRDNKDVATFTRTPTNTWTTTGNWPANEADLQPILNLLGSLSSRFQPEPIENATPSASPLLVAVTLRDGTRHVLTFTEPPGDESRFVRTTHLRLDDKPERLRLAPGLITDLSRPADQYRARRLFPAERTTRHNNPQERIERLDAKELVLLEKDKPAIRLVKAPQGWQLTEPSPDHLDPDTGEKLLTAVADLWAERFFTPDETAKTLPSAGLAESTQSIQVTRHDGSRTTLVFGNRSRGDTPPPPPRPGAPPPPADTYRYAKLEGSDVLFEVQDSKLNDVFASFDQLRDNRIARFNSDDVEEIEIRQGGQMAKLVKEKKDSWKMLSPRDTAADNDKVKDLLQKLSSLEAPDRDLLSPSKRLSLDTSVLGQSPLVALTLVPLLRDPVAALGMDKPAAEVSVLLREKARSDDRDRSKERTLTLRIARTPANRLYVQQSGWPRIDALDDSLSQLIDKPAVSYRGKQLFDFTARDVAQVTIQSVAQSTIRSALGALAGTPSMAERGIHVVLQRAGDEWNLTTPVTTAADAIKVNDLLDALGKAKMLAAVADDVPNNDLQPKYGVGVPTLQVTLSFTDPAKSVKALLIGAERFSEPGYFARVGESRDVVALPNELRDRLSQSALSYLPSTLWQIAADDEIQRFRIAKAGQDEYQLVRKGTGWEVTGPFTVAAPTDVVERLSAAMMSPRAEEYRAITAGDLGTYGLTNPGVKVSVTTKSGKEHSLWLGADATGSKPGRYARLGTGGSVFVVSDLLAKSADQSALDFLDRNLLTFDTFTVNAISRTRGKDALELVRQDDAWKLTKPSEQPADERKVPELLARLGTLRAERILAYKPKDLKPFGLDSPFATLTIKLASDKAPEHVLLLGREEGIGGRVAMVKDAPMVAVLPANVVKQLLAGPIAFRNHDLARIPDADTMKLAAGERKVTFARPEGTWKVSAPVSVDADHDGLEAYFNALSRLRADELVAEKPTAEELKTYGLDKPIARWQILSGDDSKLDLILGGPGPEGKRRYARLGDKDVVFLLDEKLSTLATTEYRPRAVWKDTVDPAQIEAVKFGYQKDPFELKKLGDQWTVAGKPDAKLNAATVSDTLSALRDLKLERYVKDDAAQLKLYQLEPPELVLEVTTPTGKHVLHVGGLEGGSKRRYARLPESKFKDVFLLDEAASTKLGRTLGALAKPVLGDF